LGVPGAVSEEISNSTTTAAKPPLNFEDDVVPILEARCFRCHGAETRKSGLDLRRKFTMLKGSDGGPVIVPGKPDESTLVEMISKKEMPPKEEDPLDARQIELLRRWVAAGAPIKGETEAPLEATDAEDKISDDDRRFWAFQPPVRTAVPVVKTAGRVRNPIDAFLLARLEEKGLSFSPEASRAVLLRRVCFDLTGLPPTPQQFNAFLVDDRPDAYEQLVDALLDSPRYGERWARHWLDVAGYADTDGYLDADRDRPQAWYYRDYVIRALNNDKPYDQFVREQIAGDELSDWRRAPELTPEMAEQLIATGFLRTASDPTYPGYKEKQEIHKVLADTMQIIGSTFFGLTLQCARCHAHKSEPIAQRDYYQIHALLVASYDPDRWLASSERFVPLATESQQEKTNAYNAAVNARISALNAEQVELFNQHRDKFLNEKLTSVPDDVRDKVKAALLVAADKRSDEQKALAAGHAPTVAVDEKMIHARFPDLKPELDKLKAAVAAETALLKNIVPLRGLVDLDDKPPVASVLRRGDFNNRGKAVEPGVPAVLSAADFKFQPQPGYKTTGRRKAFAEWLVNPRQPTTARVQVNRMWAHHFGRGLVETVDDFGHSGRLPSHPELLDWLAAEFIVNKWSQKAMHRLMVTSSAYRQSVVHDPARVAVDPDNILLGTRRPLRHEGEVLRDSVLAVAGKLNPQMFGTPVPVARQSDGSVITADDAQGNRRSVYIVVRRNQPVTLLETFDTPKMEINCSRRTEATVATQALTLLNSPFMEANAAAVAQRITGWSADREARLTFAWKLLFSREPTARERQSVGEFLDTSVKVQLGDKLPAATAEEKAGAERTAWIQVALALLNTNEFLFVD
jgi:hypothetical protein